MTSFVVNTIVDGEKLSIYLTANDEGAPEKQLFDELFQKLDTILGNYTTITTIDCHIHFYLFELD